MRGPAGVRTNGMVLGVKVERSSRGFKSPLAPRTARARRRSPNDHSMRSDYAPSEIFHDPPPNFTKVMAKNSNTSPSRSAASARLIPRFRLWCSVIGIRLSTIRPKSNFCRWRPRISDAPVRRARRRGRRRRYLPLPSRASLRPRHLGLAHQDKNEHHRDDDENQRPEAPGGVGATRAIGQRRQNQHPGLPRAVHQYADHEHGGAVLRSSRPARSCMAIRARSPPRRIRPASGRCSPIRTS